MWVGGFTRACVPIYPFIYKLFEVSYIQTVKSFDRSLLPYEEVFWSFRRSDRQWRERRKKKRMATTKTKRRKAEREMGVLYMGGSRQFAKWVGCY